ncbi:MAG: hypothetical protein HYS18_03210 [Burkholderiales bacterium]|nr:hypothetical protein [Burkholderiales bacterium]
MRFIRHGLNRAHGAEANMKNLLGICTVIARYVAKRRQLAQARAEFVGA